MISDYMKNRQALKLGIKPPEEKKKQQPIAKRGDKMKEAFKEYKPLIKQFLARPENEHCAIRSEVCTGNATCVNHRKRRGSNLLNEKYFQPSCGPCNSYIESHTQWAMDNGHLISVHKIEK